MSERRWPPEGFSERDVRAAAQLLNLLEHQRECTAPDILRSAQELAVASWLRLQREEWERERR